MPEAAIARVRRGRADVSGDSLLPGVLAEVAEAAGHEAAIKIALEWGGRDIHIPRPGHLKGCPSHRLVVLLGSEVASAVSDRIGGGSIYIPRARRACAVYLVATGLSVAQVTERLAISSSAVRRYVRSS